jgi:carbon-monoxide dehydrogenase medium subunit
VPLLAHAASHVGDAQVRHRGTIGGSIAHADPASDLPATTLALGATYVVQGPKGKREIAAKDFYRASWKVRWLPMKCSWKSRCRR